MTNRMVARQLRDANCSIVGVLADIAGDRKIDPAIRFRAADRIAGMLFAPQAPDRAGGRAPVDVGGIISRTWQRDSAADDGPTEEPGADEGAGDADDRDAAE
jgi:hypothetical protein